MSVCMHYYVLIIPGPSLGGTRSLLTASEACAKYSAIGNERQGNLRMC